MIEVKKWRNRFLWSGDHSRNGEIAKQADGAVIIRYGDTVTLSTACASNQAKNLIDFFPLTVSFEEKLYSVGKIPGGFYVVKEDQANMRH